jgi:5-methyltetrahydropteroyltriglutamate--homocysteine methyltransferase
MKTSTTRILTTPVGSLPRPHDLIQLLLESQARPGADRAALDASVQRAVADVVRRQARSGLDVINDGEQGRVDYTVYLKDRLTGFDGQSTPPLGTGDEEFPELAAILRQFASPFQHRPACTGPVAGDWPAVEADIHAFGRHGGVAPEEHFMTSPSPGQSPGSCTITSTRTTGVSVRAADVMQAQCDTSTPASSCSSIARTSR